MFWSPNNIAFALQVEGILSEEERKTIEDISENEVIKNKEDIYSSKSATELRRILSEKGYDGIVYQNMFEVGGSMFNGEVQIMVTDRGYIFHDITKIKRLPVNGGQTEINSVAASGSPLEGNNIPSNDSIPNSHNIVKEISPLSEVSAENAETDMAQSLINDTPQNSKPTTDREWQAFCRSFANKTNDLKNGETKDIIITTADSCYFVFADGYMSGTITSKTNIDEYIERIEAYGNISRTTVSDFGNERNGNRQGNDSNRSNIFENQGRDSFDVELDAFIRANSESSGYTVKSKEDYRRELKEGWKKVSADNKKSKQFSLTETTDADSLLEQYENGEITRDEYLERIKGERTLNPVEIGRMTKEGNEGNKDV